MIKKEIRVTNELGLHARPCSILFKAVDKFTSEFLIENDGFEVDGKSIINLMMLAAAQDTVLKLTTTGDDEEELMKVIIDLFKSNFGE